MIRKLLLTICLILPAILNAQTDSTAVLPQDTVWKKGGLLTLTFNQTSLSNWAAGGENALSLNGIAAFFTKYKKDKVAWDNNLDLAYGFLKQGDDDIVKNDDRIELNSKLGYQAFKSKVWYYTALVNAKTQFAPGYNEIGDTMRVKISDFAAPAYVLLSLGLDYKPTDYFSVYISPLTAKFTIVNNQRLADLGSFGVDAATYNPITGEKIEDGETLRSEFGAYLNARFQKDIMQNVNLMTKLDLFSNYQDNPQNIDVNFDLLLGMKVNKLITVSLGVTVIYDDDIMIIDGDKVGPRTQMRQVFGVGFAKKF